MSESISTVSPYDPSSPYSVLNPNAAQYVVAYTDNMATVPSYDLMLLDDPSPPVEELERKQKVSVEEEPRAKRPEPREIKEEPKKKKRFFNF